MLASSLDVTPTLLSKDLILKASDVLRLGARLEAAFANLSAFETIETIGKSANSPEYDGVTCRSEAH